MLIEKLEERKSELIKSLEQMIKQGEQLKNASMATRGRIAEVDEMIRDMRAELKEAEAEEEQDSAES